MNPILSHPVLTCAEAKAWEANFLKDEAAEWAAMQEAGEKIAHAVLEDFREIGGLPSSARLLVLVGKGHNGGDALLAARAILVAHPDAHAVVVLCFGPGELRPLAGRSLDRLQADAPDRVQLMPAGRALNPDHAYALCLDGIFGFQFRTPMDESIAQLIEQVNTHRAIQFRAAVDLPSGVGETSAPTVFRADFTYATGIVKSPVVAVANASWVGRLRYLDLGFFKVERVVPNAPERVLLPSILAPLAELRPSQSDKRTFGHLFVVGGSLSYPGAVVLAVRAALRSGVGLVTAFVPEQLVPEYASRHPEAMWVGCPVNAAGGLARGTQELVEERLTRADALLIGPGLGADPETIGVVQAVVLNRNIPLVLDADALRREVLDAVKDRAFVATPHAGEFQRIAPVLFSDGKLIAPHGVLVLKGPMTRIVSSAVLRPAASGQSETGPTTYYSPFGGPVLARGGSGDILAGLIGGLLAQTPDDPALAACRGAVWHGRAADLLARAHGQVSVETSQLLEQLGPALSSTT